MEVTFKYEIGQLVYVRQVVRAWHERFDSLEAASKKSGYPTTMAALTAAERKPHSFQVIERNMQQCYGGIQLHYHVRGAEGLQPFTEPELTADFNDPSLTGQ